MTLAERVRQFDRDNEAICRKILSEPHLHGGINGLPYCWAVEWWRIHRGGDAISNSNDDGAGYLQR